MIYGELHQIITGDNQTYSLTDGNERFVVSIPDSLGLPDIDFVTRRPYKADYELEIDYHLDQRQISIPVLWKPPASDFPRNDYWNARKTILDIIRPNRSGQLTYIIRLENEEIYAIKGRAIAPDFSGDEPDLSPGEDGISLQEIFQIRCFNPVFFNPEEIELTACVLANQNIVQNIVIPINSGFSVGGVSYSTEQLGQSFIHEHDFLFVRILLSKIGAPVGDLTITIHEDNGGIPGTILHTSGIIYESLAPIYPLKQFFEFYFNGVISLTVGQRYHIVLNSSSGTDALNHVVWWANGILLLKDGLIAWWTFEEENGNRIDSHNGRTLVPTNNPLAEPGKILNAVGFEPSANQLLTDATFPFFTEFKFGIWVYLKDITTTQGIAGKWGTAGNREWRLYLTGGQFAASFSFDGTNFVTVTATNFGFPEPERWYFVEVAFRDLFAEVISVNGIGTVAFNAINLFNSGSPLTVGGVPDTAFGIVRIDEFAFYDKFLTGGNLDELLYNEDSGITYDEIQNDFDGKGLLYDGSDWIDTLSTFVFENVCLTQEEHLIFPITFPIQFGSDRVFWRETISYEGTWYSYPTFRIDGPFLTLRLIHEEKNAVINFVKAVNTGDYIILDLDNKTLVDSNGNDLFGFLDPTSDLVDFRLEPVGELAGGINTIRVELESYDLSYSRASMTYYRRYIGL